MEHPWDRRLGVWWIAEDHPEAPAIVDSPSGRTLTFGELAAAAHRVANALRAQGIRDGDVVAYALPNDVDAIIWQLATARAKRAGTSPGATRVRVRPTRLVHSPTVKR